MNGSFLLRAGAAVICLGAAPLALAQTPIGGAVPPAYWGFIGVMAGMGILFLLGVFALGVLNENRKNRDKLAVIERLVASGQAVPRELITGEKPPLPLPQERRRDIRRGITLLCWAIAVTLIPVIGSGGEWRHGVWGLLFLLPSLGSFFKAWLTAREIARGASNDSLQR